ncbi:hypothetical protein ASPWEDRAFT_41323 [Aspergillus wentii DTO 134E9]|uniref:Delta(24)-sterol reductase n=1 Tax=Aspergillus wentii DTO 134E9 TaxID=1073089 RepID=A0A1L9RMA9_ASPWE|nr:uncharacterized protein ASPWEDRAFT_41323 [Aspergillus wentii DTO 134E9]KAI9929473.1 Delta(24)-sterol reductase [Aspergillus wentii]OJJ36085.1 hypothetical protein ASPWEDRAFT_41323 [Aspergillus wentii DTO 134E9]
MEEHDIVVAKIASQVRQFYDRKQPYHIYHGSTNCTRKSSKTASNTIDTSSLKRTFSIDSLKQTIQVEPNVSMDELVQATLPHGFIPPVVMEFSGITAGGGFAGTSGESSSFRHGFFDRTVKRVELVLANGEVVEASPLIKPDLFYGAASSFGSLGITTLLEISLIHAKPYVELTYFPICGMPDALDRIAAITADPTAGYLDGIMYSKTKGVICKGSLVDTADEQRIQRFTRPTDPWFYMHVEKYVESAQPVTEFIPLFDYLFRYDRGGFWVGKYAFEYFRIPQSRFTRWLLDGISHTSVMYHAVHKSGLFNRYIIQDIAIPYAGAEEFVNYLDDSFQKYPLWLCPLRQTTRALDESQIHGLLAQRHDKDAHLQPDMMLNFGVWGPGPEDYHDCVRLNKEMERKVQSLGGEKWLYGRTYYTEEHFWSIYNRKPLDALREKYHATYLPTLFEKVRVNLANDGEKSMGMLDGLYGLLHTFIHKEYLLSEKESWMGRAVFVSIVGMLFMYYSCIRYL